jgi:BirA family biotin operon repressor/biotin-[acetyl-CoA-carboxylase] ligase
LEALILSKRSKFPYKINMTHPFIELQTVNSTNTYAEKLLESGEVKEGTVIYAHEQTSGKGQGDNSWESSPGQNATFSFILFPEFLHPENVFLLNKTISLGMIDFLSQFVQDHKLSVKWPNDIYFSSFKIGGILIQNTICGSRFESCIAGIGLNLNQGYFSPDLPNPVSLKQITGKEFPVTDAIHKIVDCIDDRYLQLRLGLIQVLDNEYQKRLLGLNDWRDYFVNKKVIKGKVTGVDESGRLVLEMLDGSIRYLNHGEVKFSFQ